MDGPQLGHELSAGSQQPDYGPASWTSYLDVDAQGTAVTLQSALGLALDVCHN